MYKRAGESGFFLSGGPASFIRRVSNVKIQPILLRNSKDGPCFDEMSSNSNSVSMADPRQAGQQAGKHRYRSLGFFRRSLPSGERAGESGFFLAGRAQRWWVSLKLAPIDKVWAVSHAESRHAKPLKQKRSETTKWQSLAQARPGTARSQRLCFQYCPDGHRRDGEAEGTGKESSRRHLGAAGWLEGR